MAELNPQRILFKESYCNPESDTFGNIKQSAIIAGFSDSYSKGLMSDSVDNNWVKEIINDYQLLSKAEKKLNEAIDIDIRDDKIGDRSLKASIFVAKTLGKHKYSERQEHTGADGKDLEGIIMYPIKDERSKEENTLGTT